MPQTPSATNNSNYNVKAFKYCCLVAMAFCIYVLFLDKQFIDPAMYKYYVMTRLLNFSVVGICLWLSTRNKDMDKLVTTYYIAMQCYAITGQFFVQYGYLAFFELALIVGLLFPMKNNRYFKLTVILGLIMIAAISYSDINYATDPVMANKFKTDSIFAVIIGCAISMMAHRYVTQVREKKDIESLKFLDVGKNVSSVVHELKGLMSGPRLYLKVLNREVDKNPGLSDTMKKAISNLERDYLELVEYVQAVNNLTVNNFNQENISVPEYVQNVIKTLFTTPSKNLKMEVVGEGQIICSKDVLKRVVVNLLNNSIENFAQKSVANGQITVEVKGNVLKVKDNGGGFDFVALRKVNSNQSFSTKSEGTGLGLYMIKESVASVGGKIKFYNEDGGAVAEITFKKPQHLEEKAYA